MYARPFNAFKERTGQLVITDRIYADFNEEFVVCRPKVTDFRQSCWFDPFFSLPVLKLTEMLQRNISNYTLLLVWMLREPVIFHIRAL